MPRWKRILIGLLPTFIIISFAQLAYDKVFFDKDYTIIKKSRIIEKKGKKKYLKMRIDTAHYQANDVTTELRLKTECTRISKHEMECIMSKYNLDTDKWEVRNKKRILR